MESNTEESPSPSSDRGEGVEHPRKAGEDSAQCCTQGMRKGKPSLAKGSQLRGSSSAPPLGEEQARSTCSR